MFKNKIEFSDLTLDNKLSSNRYESRLGMLTFFSAFFVLLNIIIYNYILSIITVIFQIAIIITFIVNAIRLHKIHYPK